MRGVGDYLTEEVPEMTDQPRDELELCPIAWGRKTPGAQHQCYLVKGHIGKCLCLCLASAEGERDTESHFLMCEAHRSDKFYYGCVDCINRAIAMARSLRIERDTLKAAVEQAHVAGRMMLKATNELMIEFVSKKRAANWVVINDATVAMQAALTSAAGGASASPTAILSRPGEPDADITEAVQRMEVELKQTRGEQSP